MSRPGLRRAAERQVLAFTHPIGTRVVARGPGGALTETVTTSTPRVMGHHTAVVELRDIGECLLKRVEVKR